MKKILFSILLLFTLAGLVAGQAAAEDAQRLHKPEVGLLVASKLSDEQEILEGTYIGGNLAYGIHPAFSAGASSGWVESDFDVRLSEDNVLEGGTVTLVPLFGELTFRERTLDKVLKFYAVIGAGGVFVSGDTDRSLDLLSLRIEAKDGFAVKLGGGFEWTVTRNWILFLEASYVLTDARIDIVNAQGAVSAREDLDYWLLGGGARYVFD